MKKMGIALAGAAFLLAGAANSAHAEFIAYIYQSGANVVASGSGTIDLNGLTFNADGNVGAGVIPSSGVFLLGPTGGTAVNTYSGLSGPTSFGSGGLKLANSGSGNMVGIVGDDEYLDVPAGYVSGGLLSDTITFTNTTLAALGLTDGTYTWSWDSSIYPAVADDSVVLNVGVSPTPLPAALPLFAGGIGLVGLLARRRKRQPSALATV
jgi:hypothetical protein